jgi:flagellar biosynthetic protein FliP
MFLARAIKKLCLLSAMLIVTMPALQAQPLSNVPMAGMMVASESFWVNHAPGRVKTLQKHVASSAGSKKEMDEKTNSGLGEDSISKAIAANRSVPWSIVLGLTLLTLLPALLLSITPMVRLLVVFHFLRQALGTQTAPSNQILMGLALMMTWFLMQPVLLQVEQVAVVPYQQGTISGMEAMDRGLVPVKAYMLRYAREKDLEVFAAAGVATRPQSRADLPIQVIVPAYILSELKAGFQIGAVLFLPFLLVDLVVASVTTSVGMMQLPPVVISTPLKILLFVMVDGWNLLAHQLIKSF